MMGIRWKTPKTTLKTLESVAWIAKQADVRYRPPDRIEVQVVESQSRAHLSRLLFYKDTDWVPLPPTPNTVNNMTSWPTGSWQVNVSLSEVLQAFKQATAGSLDWTRLTSTTLEYVVPTPAGPAKKKLSSTADGSSAISPAPVILPIQGSIAVVAANTSVAATPIPTWSRSSAFDEWMKRPPTLVVQEPALFQNLASRLSVMQPYFQLSPVQTVGSGSSPSDLSRWLVLQSAPHDDAQYVIPLSGLNDPKEEGKKKKAKKSTRTTTASSSSSSSTSDSDDSSDNNSSSSSSSSSLHLHPQLVLGRREGPHGQRGRERIVVLKGRGHARL